MYILNLHKSPSDNNLNDLQYISIFFLILVAVLFPPSGFEPTANASVCYRIFELFLHCSKSVGNWMMLLF
uniref:Uncharacterized protein n=1 Tax=Schistosoma mansoni TaxID=6183 RepID=A0A913KVN0_SCHMA